MRIRHAKVSNVPDGPDTGSVRPSDWNADHAVAFDGREVDVDFTVTPTDNLLLIRVNSATPILCSISNELPANFHATFIQTGSGTLSFTTLAGATLNHVSAHTATAGQYAVVHIVVTDNSDGLSANAVLYGDTAP